MKIVYLLIFFLILINVNSLETPFGIELEEYRHKLNEFKLDFHRSFENTRIRRKRNANHLYIIPNVGALIEEHLRVESVSTFVPNGTLGFDSVRTINAIRNGEQTLLFWGQQNGLLSLADFKITPLGLQLILLAQYNEVDNGVPIQSNYFYYDNHLWMVMGYQKNVREYVAIYQVIHNRFYRKQTIEAGVMTDFDIIVNNDVIYIAIAYHTQTPTDVSCESVLKLFEWRHTQFDFIGEEISPGIVSVKLFNIGSHLYAAAAQSCNTMTINDESHVYVYNALDERRLSIVDTMKMDSAIKVEHFKVDGNDYLVLLSWTEDARIYWWGGDQFLEYQILHDTKSAISVSPIHLPNAEILLAIIFTDRAKFFTESTNSFYNMTSEIIIPETQFETIQLFYHFNYYALFTFSVNQKSLMSNIWKLNLAPYVIRDNEYDALTNCMINLDRVLNEREEELQQLASKAERVWVSNKPQNVTATVIIKGSMEVKEHVIHSQNILLTNKSHVPQITNTQVNTRIDALMGTLNSIIGDVPNYVSKSANQTIYGTLTFTKHINAMASHIGFIANSNALINKLPLNTLAYNSLTLDDNQIITGHLTLHQNLTVDHIEVRGLINDLNINDILFKNLPYLQEVNGNHQYYHVTSLSDLLLNPHGTINGISPFEFVTISHVNQEIHGQKTFQMFEAKNNIIVNGFTNEKDLSDIVNRAVLLQSHEQIIRGHIIFESPIRVGVMRLNGLINKNINITELALNSVNIYDEQLITGRKTFLSNVTVHGDIQMSGTVNGIVLHTDVITTNTEQSITGNIIFKSPVTFTDNINTELINGIDLSIDAVRINIEEPQFIDVTKSFNRDIIINEDIIMNHGITIDGVDPSQLIHLDAQFPRMNVNFDSPLAFDHLIIRGHIQLPTINGYSIFDLPQISWLKSVNQTIPVPTKFSGTIEIQHFFSNLINELQFPQNYVLRETVDTEIVNGEKIFTHLIDVNGNIEVSETLLINSIDLSRFAIDTVMKDSASDMIYGVKRFKYIHVNESVITERVNGLVLHNDVMLIHTPQTINVNIRFAAPVTEFIGPVEVSGNIYTNGIVNNITISRFWSDIVYGGSPLINRPIRNKRFVDGISVNQITSYGTISGVNIEEMKRRVIMVNVPIFVNSTKTFTGITRFINEFSCITLNNINLTDYVPRIILRTAPMVVYGPLTIRGNTYLTKNIEVIGKINNIDIRSLSNRAMMRHGDNVIQSHFTFSVNLAIDELTLEPLATIDGIFLRDIIFLNDEHLIFDGHINIYNNITVNEEINVNLINNCDLKRLASEALNIEHHIIHGITNIANLTVNGNIYINDSINGINLVQLSSRIVTKNSQQILYAPLTFDSIVNVESLFVYNLINDKNLTFILNDAVLRSKTQTIIGRKRFNNVILNATHFRALNYVTVEGTVNGVNIFELNQTVVKKNQNVIINGVKTFTGPVSFRGNIYVDGKVNDIKIPENLVLVNSSDLIPGITVFTAPITIETNLQVNGLIDGVNLLHFLHNRITLTGENEIIAHIDYNEHINIKNLIVRQSINGIPIHAFVTRHGHTVINGEKTFINGIEIFGDLITSGPINGIDIRDISNRAVSLMKPETIPETTEFLGPVAMTNMMVTGVLNGVDISDAATFYQNLIEEIKTAVDSAKMQISFQEKEINEYFCSINHSPSEIDYFKQWQILPEIGERFFINTHPSLIAHIYTTHSVMLWSIKSDAIDCREYFTITYYVSSDGYLIPHNTSHFGRYFSLTDKPINDRSNLLLWTNTTKCDALESEEMRMQTLHIDELYFPHTKIENDYYSNIFKSAPYLKDAKIFNSNGHNYLFLANNYNRMTKSYHTNSSVLWLDSVTRQWVHIQDIETFGVTSIDIVSIINNSQIFVAIANGLTLRGNNALSYIMQWNEENHKFELNTVIQTSNPSDVKFITTHDNELFVVYANTKAILYERTECGSESGYHYTQPINVYHYDGKYFKHVQSIDLHGAVSLESFRVSDETFLAVASPHLGTTTVLKFRGINLFQSVYTIQTPGVENVKAFYSNDGSLLLAVASSIRGHSKILKAMISGGQIMKYSSIDDLMRTDVNY